MRARITTSAECIWTLSRDRDDINAMNTELVVTRIHMSDLL